MFSRYFQIRQMTWSIVFDGSELFIYVFASLKKFLFYFFVCLHAVITLQIVPRFDFLYIHFLCFHSLMFLTLVLYYWETNILYIHHRFVFLIFQYLFVCFGDSRTHTRTRTHAHTCTTYKHNYIYTHRHKDLLITLNFLIDLVNLKEVSGKSVCHKWLLRRKMISAQKVLF